MAKIYVASSWRNQYFPEVVKKLREYGHEITTSVIIKVTATTEIRIPVMMFDVTKKAEK